ncbi:MAG: GNAT family N-acetyltransferase [Parvularculaceae bacterium]
MSGWRVRQASSADAEALAAVEAAAFGPHSWGERSVKGGLAAPYVSALLVFGPASAAPAGFALWRRLGGEAEILSLGVAPASRRKGAGGALLRAILAEARSARLGALFLEVEVGNRAASALYAKHGFARIGIRRAYYRHGADAEVLRLGLHAE